MLCIIYTYCKVVSWYFIWQFLRKFLRIVSLYRSFGKKYMYVLTMNYISIIKISFSLSRSTQDDSYLVFFTRYYDILVQFYHLLTHTDQYIYISDKTFSLKKYAEKGIQLCFLFLHFTYLAHQRSSQINTTCLFLRIYNYFYLLYPYICIIFYQFIYRYLLV